MKASSNTKRPPKRAPVSTTAPLATAKVSVESPMATMARTGSIPRYNTEYNPITSNVELRERVHEVISVQRATVQARRGSYRAAMNPRTRVNTPFGGSGDQHVDMWSRRMLRELSRDLDRNADTFRVMADAFASAAVGEGIKYRPKTSDMEWNKKAARLVDEKMRKDKDGVDIRAIRSGYRIQFDLVRGFVVDGEMGFLKLANGKVQPIETEQITNGGHIESGDVDGVLTDGLGKVIGFHICPFDDWGRMDYGAGADYSADDVEWTANRNRFSQTRGTPLVVACLEDWERLDSYKESEIIAAEQGSQIYGAIQHRPGDMGTSRPWAASGADPGSVLRSGLKSVSDSDGRQIDWQPTVAGALLDLPDGKEYKPVDPARPNPNAAPFMMELLRQFCANGGLPYEFVYNDVRGLSWSVNRALVQMARDRVAIWQTQFFAPIFCNFYQWLVAFMIRSGELEANPEWEVMELDWPKISWPDEGAEFEAQADGLLKGLTTRHRLHGAQWRDILDERMAEMDYASELAIAHNKKFPDFPVTPHFVLGFEKDTEMISSRQITDNEESSNTDPTKSKSNPPKANAGKPYNGRRQTPR